MTVTWTLVRWRRSNKGKGTGEGKEDVLRDGCCKGVEGAWRGAGVSFEAG